MKTRRRRIEALGYDYAAREKETVAACNLCGSEGLIEVAREDRYGFPADLWICLGCGLGFLSPRLTAREYADFYGHVYRPLVSAFHGRRIDAETVREDQRSYAAELVAFLNQGLPRPPATVMDIGGSTGVVADAVRDSFGASATVLDPASEELALAEKAGMETILGLVESYDPAGRTWDLVLLCQTIDHLLDISSTLATVRGMLSSSGHAFIDVLDVLFVSRREGSVEEAAKIDHPYYLTRHTAEAYFARAGLCTIASRLSHDGHWGFLLRPDETHEPDWDALSAEADRLLEELGRLRARTG